MPGRQYKYAARVPEFRCPVLVDGKPCLEAAGCLGELGNRGRPVCPKHVGDVQAAKNERQRRGGGR